MRSIRADRVPSMRSMRADRVPSMRSTSVRMMRLSCVVIKVMPPSITAANTPISVHTCGSFKRMPPV